MSTHLSRSDFDIDLGKYFLVLKRRWLPATFVVGLVTVLATVSALMREPSYHASGKVLVKLDRTPSLAGLDIPGRKSIGEPDSIGLSSDPIATEVETIRSLEVAEKTITALALADDEGQPLSADDFFKALDVKPIPGTDMIRIGYENTDPDLAATIVNQTIDAYRDNNIATKQAEAIAARQFIAAQLPRTEEAVQQAEAALRRFKEDNQIVLLAEESIETIKAMKVLETEISQAQSQLATVTAQSQELQQRLGMPPQAALQATTLSQSVAVQETLTQIRDVQGQLDVARASYREPHPAVTNLKRQEVQLQQRLRDRVTDTIGIEIGAQTSPAQGSALGLLEQDLTANLLQSEVERVGLINRINELQQWRIAQQQRADLFPRLEATQRQLERELTVAQSTYEPLLQRLQDVQVAQNQTIDNIRVVSRALVPEDPTFSKKIIVAAGLLVGAMLGVIIAFVIDLWDRSVKTVEEAQELLELPIVGVVPDSGKDAPLVKPFNENQTNMPDPYLLLLANLSFIRSQMDCNIIGITSSVAGEGRSQVAANLAIAAARSGIRVLLIDGDLHQPHQHHIWQCPNRVGLLQVLDETLDPKAAITAINPNLSLLPSGAHPDQDTEVLNAHALHTLLQYIAPGFDLVLLDTSPLTQNADASTFGSLVDGSLLVVRPKFAQVLDLKAAKVLMELSGKPTLGMVINGVGNGTDPMQYFNAVSNYAEFPSKPSVIPSSPTVTEGRYVV